MDTTRFASFDGRIIADVRMEGCGGWIDATTQDGKIYKYSSQEPFGHHGNSWTQFYCADDGECLVIDGNGIADLWESEDEAREILFPESEEIQ